MGTPLYRHTGTGLLRAAALPLTAAPDRWPDLDRPDGWLQQIWANPDLAAGIRQASGSLASRLDAWQQGRELSAKELRRAAMSVTRYVLRATSRPTPFGLFAGVAPLTIGDKAAVRMGRGHRVVATADCGWLDDVITRLEAVPALLERLDVMWNNLTARRGGSFEAPQGPGRVSVRATAAVDAVHQTAAGPVAFTVVEEKLAALFPGTAPAKVHRLLVDLVTQGLLITSLRAPMTVPDPLAHLNRQLAEAGADSVTEVEPLLLWLGAIQAGLEQHNRTPDGPVQARARRTLSEQAAGMSTASRGAPSVHLRLDAVDVSLPGHVAEEGERAATALLKLTREPTGHPIWRDYYIRFCERYGTNTLVPVTEVVHPDAGLGYPATYPASTLQPPAPFVAARDEQLAALAWNARPGGEVVLTEETISRLGGDRIDPSWMPPHVEMACRIHATSLQAIEAGDYELTVAPARAAGTLTSRFAETACSQQLAEVYAGVPTITDGALPAQLSVPSVYPRTENICRVPARLPHVISLGEPPPAGVEAIGLDDLAVTAIRRGLFLVSISRRRIVEPQMFHGLALEKQLPPLARFLAHLSRSHLPCWTEFDWGPHAQLPFLPRVRYRKSVLSPARWNLTGVDLAAAGSMEAWRERWACPQVVELRDHNRSMRLDLAEPAHQELLHTHLKSEKKAALTEAGDVAGLGWIAGHAHEIVFPLVSATPAAPDPLTAPLPLISNATHRQSPTGAGSQWLTAKLFTHPERMAEIITTKLPTLLAVLGDPGWWFVRYRSAHETDHLRLRIHTNDTAAVAAWADELRRDGMATRLVFDSYMPETGRYGPGESMQSAEKVFVADTSVVAAQLHHQPALDPVVLAVAGMVATVRGLLGAEDGMQWLKATPTPRGAHAGRETAAETVRAVRALTPLGNPGWPEDLATAWQARHDALAAYRQTLPISMDTSALLESLMHMHHNRQIGIDPDGEAVCRRLARQAAHSSLKHPGRTPTP